MVSTPQVPDRRRDRTHPMFSWVALSVENWIIGIGNLARCLKCWRVTAICDVNLRQLSVIQLGGIKSVDRPKGQTLTASSNPAPLGTEFLFQPRRNGLPETSFPYVLR